MSPQASSAHSFHFSNSDNDSMDIHDENYNGGKKRPSQKKQSGACVDCKSVKVRCEFIAGERKCRRCQAKNLPCQPRERKKRKAADTHEQLQERSHEQDIHIQNLLKQYDQRVAEQKVHHWVSNSSIPRMGDTAEGNWLHKGKSPELAVMSYYAGDLGIPTQHLVLPGIVKHCSLFPEDIQQLFSIFFTHINPYFSILDETYHTPEKLLWTSPFLFTVLCGVASRYYTARPNLYSLAMEFARDLAGQGLVEGHRSVDVCQAYLIMAVYPVPKKKWAEDRSWLLMGVAIRMAIELELNQPPPSTCDEREALNRTRTWLNCYCVDGSHATQYGKLPMLSLDDYLARNSREWYRSSPMNTPYDIHLCAYVQILMQLAHWREYMKQEGDCSTKPQEIVTAALQMQEQLSTEMGTWAEAYAAEFEFTCRYISKYIQRQFTEWVNSVALPISIYLGNTTQLIVAYLRLVVLLAGFQKMRLEDLSRGSEILIKSVDAARTVIQIANERLYPSGYLRYAMESNFLYMSFAAAFLINLFRPRYLSLLDATLRQEIVVSVSRLISILGSNDVALDGRHTPAVHSNFLSELMLKRGLTMNNMWALSREQSPHTDPAHRQLTPPDEFSWPDIPVPPTPSQNASLRLGSGCGAQFQSDRLMDYSLSHFIKTVIAYAPTPSDMDVATNMTWDSSWKSEEEPTIMWSPPTAPQGIWAS